MKNLAQDTVGLLIGRARQRLTEVLIASVAKYRVTPQQFWIVLMVLEGADLTSRDVAARLSVDKSTASRLIDKLVRQRWIRMTPSPDDKRRFLLQLTPTGLRQARELRQIALWLDKEIVNSIHPEDLAVVIRSLRQVIDRLEALAKPRRKPARSPKK
jgi:DNA-binding MarR family transcriptional regulator